MSCSTNHHAMGLLSEDYYKDLISKEQQTTSIDISQTQNNAAGLTFLNIIFDLSVTLLLIIFSIKLIKFIFKKIKVNINPVPKEYILSFINKKNGEIVILIIYTLLNLKILSTFIFDEGSLIGAVYRSGGGSSLLAIFIGLFLNAALWLYWLKKT